MTMNLDAFFDLMASWPVNMAKQDLLELVNADLWKTDPETAAELALRRSGRFDGDAYLRLNRDLVLHKIDPYWHYIRHGITENREFPVVGSLGTPKVSIILRSHDGQNDIDSSLSSLQSQIMEGLEIIIVNENPEDSEFAQKLNRYAQNRANTKVLHKKYAGYGNGLNIGIDYASAPFAAFMEAGDTAEPETYEIMRNECIVHKLDFVKASSQTMNDGILRPVIKNRAYFDRILEPAKDPQAWQAEATPYSALYNVRFLRDNYIRFGKNKAKESCMETWFRIFLLAKKFKLLSRSFYNLATDMDKI